MSRVGIICGDCRQEMPRLEAESVDLIATDPPYGAGLGFAGDSNPAEAIALIAEVLPEFVRVLRPGGCLYIFCDWRLYVELLMMVREVLDWQDTIIWAYRRTQCNPKTWVKAYQQIIFASKGTPGYWGQIRVPASTRGWDTSLKKALLAVADPDGIVRDPRALSRISWGKGQRRQCDLLTAPARNWWDDIYVVTGSAFSRGEPRQHPAQKPVKLMERIIRASCPPGGLVLDPFAGSGSTLVAAIKSGRDCLGIEIEPCYVQVAEARIAAAQAKAVGQPLRLPGVAKAAGYTPTAPARQRRQEHLALRAGAPGANAKADPVGVSQQPQGGTP